MRKKTVDDILNEIDVELENSRSTKPTENGIYEETVSDGTASLAKRFIKYCSEKKLLIPEITYHKGNMISFIFKNHAGIVYINLLCDQNNLKNHIYCSTSYNNYTNQTINGEIPFGDENIILPDNIVIHIIDFNFDEYINNINNSIETLKDNLALLYEFYYQFDISFNDKQEDEIDKIWETINEFTLLRISFNKKVSIEDTYINPINGNKDKMRVTGEITREEIRNLKENFNIDAYKMLKSSMQNEMIVSKEERKYKDLVDYCISSNNSPKINVNTENAIQILTDTFFERIKLSNNIEIYASPLLVGKVIIPLFDTYLNSEIQKCKQENNDVGRMDVLTAECVITLYDENLNKDVCNVKIFVKPLLMPEDTTVLIVDTDNHKNNYFVNYEFESISDVIQKLIYINK